MQRELPILFSTAMVQAILAGNKTQTRRAVSKRNSTYTGIWGEFDFDDVVVDGKEITPQYQYLKVAQPKDETMHRVYCKYNPADVFTDRGPTILYVRESASIEGIISSNISGKKNIERVLLKYSADNSLNTIDYPARLSQNIKCCQKVANGVFKEAARIWLEVTGVRLQRLMTITDADAKAEGVLQSSFGMYRDYIANNDNACDNAGESFATLWQSINGRESWLSNPWVWVIEFKVLSTTGKPAAI